MQAHKKTEVNIISKVSSKQKPYKETGCSSIYSLCSYVTVPKKKNKGQKLEIEKDISSLSQKKP